MSSSPDMATPAYDEQRDRDLFTVSFWNALAQIKDEVVFTSARELIQAGRWSGLEGLPPSVVPRNPALSGKILAELAGRIASAGFKHDPSGHVVYVPREENEAHRRLEPVISAWVAATRGLPDLQVKAAGTCLTSINPAQLAVVACLTAAGMPWQDCLTGQVGMRLRERITDFAEIPRNADTGPSQWLAALLPLQFETLPVFRLLEKNGTINGTSETLLEALTVTDVNWKDCVATYALLRDRCPAANAQLNDELEAALGMRAPPAQKKKPTTQDCPALNLWAPDRADVLKATALIVSGQVLTSHQRVQLLAVRLREVDRARDVATPGITFLNAGVRKLKDADAVRFVQSWMAHGLPIDQCDATRPGYGVLRVAIDTGKPLTIEALLRAGADPLLEEAGATAPTAVATTPLSAMEASGVDGKWKDQIALARGILARNAAVASLARAPARTNLQELTA